MSKFIRAAVTPACVLVGLSSASACPFCDSSTAEQVRAGIFNSDFIYYAGVTLAPFPILAAVLTAIYFGPAPHRVQRAGNPSPTSHDSSKTSEPS